jgi:hypothetical protein
MCEAAPLWFPASYNSGMQIFSRWRSSHVFARALPFLVVLIASVSALAAKDFVMPDAQPARSYPANDDHPAEKVAVAIDPYDVEYKASIFSVNYRNYGFLPVFFVVTNDSDQPIALSGMKPQLNTLNRTKLSPLGIDDIVRRMSHPSRRDTPNPLPIPLPTKKVKGGVSQKTMDEIERAQFSAKAVEPHSTARGFLFFDVADISNPLAGANLYLTGVRDAKGGELMYFEIPLEKYLSAPEPKK